MSAHAAPMPLSSHLRANFASHTRNWASRSCRAIVACSLFALAFAPEFPRAESGISPAFLYAKAAGGFRWVDLAILLLALIHVTALGCSRTKTLKFPRQLAVPGIGFVFAILSATAYGYSRDGSNFFFDWRALALGTALYIVWAFWIGSTDNLRQLLPVFAICVMIRVAWLTLQYALGHSETMEGTRIPTFDGPTIACFVFFVLLALQMQKACRRVVRALWLASATATAVMVVICLRRTYWAELTVGIAILMLWQTQNRLRTMLLLLMSVALASGIAWPSLSARLRSFNPHENSSQFSRDNSDHINDVLDAWDQVRQSPILGIGLGKAYSTWRIRDWKVESVMVHNALLHVWLKYGLLGLVSYVWFHLALFRLLVRGSRACDGIARAIVVATLAFLAAQFVVTAAFTPWPYSELQLTTLISFLIAACFCRPGQNIPQYVTN